MAAPGRAAEPAPDILSRRDRSRQRPGWYNAPMPEAQPAYDPRYLAGVVLFNRRDFFEAHEVWEALWLSPDVGEDRRFVQGLIQAAVGLYHFGTGKLRGAKKLYGTARAYMEAYASPYLGLDHAAFWISLEGWVAAL